jgi:hypothetical protein
MGQEFFVPAGTLIAVKLLILLTRFFIAFLCSGKVTHCSNSYTLLEARISKTFPREAGNDHFWYQTNGRGASAMASIYEKLPHFVLEKTWGKKLVSYKLQSNKF